MAYEMGPGLIALKRFGYGSKADGDVKQAASDPKGFLRGELEQPKSLTISDSSLQNTQALLTKYYGLRAELLAVKASAKMKADDGKMADDGGKMADGGDMMDTDKAKGKPSGEQLTRKRAIRDELQDVYRSEVLARVRQAVDAKAGFSERLVAFWSNHFCVSLRKGGVGRAATGSFEREAIRPFVLGKFEDMLLAVESHPAMLNYLDNAKSIGPDSIAGQRTGKGLNENLGREIMELHTLGVGSGYTQTDVTNLARIITGWTFANANSQVGEPGTFLFRERAHEPGTIKLLGKSYPDTGVSQGQAALRDIARRPETARFIATKFAQALVSDPPPPVLVDRLAQTFRTSKGDLKALTYALVDAPEAWAPVATRMTTPYEFVVAQHRLLGLTPNAHKIVAALRTLGMPIWMPPGPNGYSYAADVWASPEGLKLRLEYCSNLADLLRDPPNPNDLLSAMCGGAPSPETKVAVSRAESRQQGLALLLMSPEMQRS